MTIALLPLVGIVIGATLQYFFTTYLENKRHHRERRTEAYIDFLKYVADAAHTDSSDPKRKEIGARITDSKARICLYGSTKVTAALGSFERLGAQLKSEKQIAAFIELVASMRSDSGTKGRAKIDDLKGILF
jgi:hypothetical protein